MDLFSFNFTVWLVIWYLLESSFVKAKLYFLYFIPLCVKLGLIYCNG